MRWLVFILAALLLLVLDSGVRHLWPTSAPPTLLLALCVFVALHAPATTSAWAGLVLGALIDLRMPLDFGGSLHDAAILGPMAVGYFTAAYVVVQLRVVLMRDSSIALAALVFVAGVFAHLVAVALLTVRGLPYLAAEPAVGWSAADQLTSRFFELLYSTLLALPVGFVLLRTVNHWGFTRPGMGPGTIRR